MSAPIEYTIDDVGGIRHARLVVERGVNRLMGENGVGKSCTFNAIVRVHGGEVELEKRDGAEHGTVRAPGKLLRIGKVVKTSKTGDECELQLGLANVSSLDRLIDPRIEDSDRAARARVRALVELLGIGVDEDSVSALCGHDPDIARWLTQTINEEAISDLMVASERARSRMHALARAEEQRAEQAQARHDVAARRAMTLLDALGGSRPVASLTVEAAKAAAIDGARQYERLVAQVEAREALEARQAALRETIGNRPDPEAAREVARAKQLELDSAEGDVAALEAEMEALRQRLATARERRASLSAEHAALLDAVTEAEQAAERWDEAKRVLDQTVEGPTRDQLPGHEARLVKRAYVVLEQAQQVAEYDAAGKEVSAATEECALATQEAARLRGLADSIPSRLGEILAKHGAPGLTVSGGRVHAIVDGKLLDFEKRLSAGQRVRAALVVAAHVYGPNEVVPLDGDYWMRLDPKRKREFAQMAYELNLVVLTEEPSDGDLRVETMAA